MNDAKPDPLTLAVTSLAQNPHWPAFVAALEARRDQWKADARDARVYHNHAELVQVTARMAELDHWLELFTDCSRVVSGDAVRP
jgi:hypothetical protein